MNIKKCFELAKYSSKNSDCKIKVGCVLVYKNKVLAISYNTTKTHPLQKIYNVYRSTNGRLFDVDKMNNGIHAEMSILINTRHLNIDYNKCKLFVYSETKNENTRLSKPCNACYKALKDNGIKYIYYTNNNNGYNYERI